MSRRRVLPSILALAALLTACSTPEDGGTGPDLNTSFAAQMASTWHYVGTPQRVQVGILASDANGIRVVTQGSLDIAFAALDGADPAPGPSVTATYVPVPGSDASGDAPTVVSGANGVYEAEDVTFDTTGAWRATISVVIDGVARELTTDFEVREESEIPAPGMPAPATATLTIDSKGVRKGSIDSSADAGGEIPDPELHEWAIADAIEQGRPALVLFGTPAYCTSRFCGPEVTELQRLAAEHPDRAVYIHVEIWKDYNAQPQVINEGAADWLLRGTPESPEMTEPWLFLIGADGVVAERWGPLFDSAEVEAALEALPPMHA
ncbi:MAG: TlpA family protein disulfide reductase [Actinomycetota bacterium]